MGLLSDRLGGTTRQNTGAAVPSYNISNIPNDKDSKSPVQSPPPPDNIHSEPPTQSVQEQKPVSGAEDDDDILASIGVKRRPQSIKNEPVQHIVEAPTEMSEEELELYALNEARNTARKVKKDKTRKRIIYTVLVTVCVYLIFLIYGVLCTDYAYNEEGQIEPVVLNVEQISEKKNFDKIKVQYENERVLYEKVLLLDYRLAQGVEDPLTLAPEYEALLDEVNSLTIKTEALDVDTKYETMKMLLLNFVKTDTAVYLQKIASGITGNNAEDASIAVQYKALMYDDFSLITQNIITIGDNVEGSDMTNIKNWSPDKFIEETVGGH